MDQKQLDELLQCETVLSKEQILEILSYIDERVNDGDSTLMGLNQSRLLANFHAFAQISLHLLKGRPDHETSRWIKEACYGLDTDTRRELQSD